MLRRGVILRAIVESYDLGLQISVGEFVAGHRCYSSTNHFSSLKPKWTPARGGNSWSQRSEPVIKPYDFGQEVKKTEEDIFLSWLREARKYTDPDALTGSLEHLRKIAETAVANLPGEERSRKDSDPSLVFLEVLKLYTVICAKGRPMKDEKEFQHSEIIRKCLRAKLESANLGKTKLIAASLLDAIEGNFNVNELYSGPSKSSSTVLIPWEFSASSFADIAYRSNRSDTMESLAETVQVSASTLDNWTHDVSDGILLLALYRLKMLMDEKKLDMRMVYPASKILSLIIARGVRLTEKERHYYEQVVKYALAKTPQIAIDEIRGSAELLLNACAGNIDLTGVNNAFVDSFSVFNLLASIVIRKDHLDLLEDLCRQLGKLRLFYTHARFPVHSTMLDVLRKAPADYDVERLARIFLDHTMSCVRSAPPTIRDFEKFIEPVISLVPQWKMKPAIIDASTRRCRMCDVILERKAVLSTEEHELLKKIFLQSIPQLGASSYSGQASVAMQSLENLQSLIAGIDMSHHSRKPLVIDAMNLIYDMKSMTKHDRTMVRLKLSKASLDFDTLYRMLFKLKDDMGFSPILVITSRPFPASIVNKLGQIGVLFLRVSGVIDDIFVLTAALILGPSARVLSNDAYTDHRENLIPDEYKVLFDIWKRSTFVTFTDSTGEVHMPLTYSNAIHKDQNGYHIAPCPERINTVWSIPSVRCVRISPERFMNSDV